MPSGKKILEKQSQICKIPKNKTASIFIKLQAFKRSSQGDSETVSSAKIALFYGQ